MEFEVTIGHGKQKDFFLRAIRKGRLHHAYALSGPEHAGKTTFALELARILGCHPMLDLLVLDSQEGIGIEEARAVESRLSLSPLGGAKKIAIITYAERMTAEASNALLKLLEEPPPRAMIILVTSNFYGLLPTIASRVQKVSFGPLPEGSLKKTESEEEFKASCQQFYNLLEGGTLIAKLQTAEELALLPTGEIKGFLKFAQRQWVKNPKNFLLGKKLYQSFLDLDYNLNTKLVLDNLFLA